MRRCTFVRLLLAQKAKRFGIPLITLAILCVNGYALAQTITGEAAATTTWDRKVLEIGVKLIGIIGVTLVGPYVAGFFTSAPKEVKLAISSLISGGIGTLLGEFTIFPLSAESTGTIGVGLGLVGQWLLNRSAGMPGQPQTPNQQAHAALTEVQEQRDKKAAEAPTPPLPK